MPPREGWQMKLKKLSDLLSLAVVDEELYATDQLLN